MDALRYRIVAAVLGVVALISLLVAQTASTSAQTGYPPPDSIQATPGSGSHRVRMPLIARNIPAYASISYYVGSTNPVDIRPMAQSLATTTLSSPDPKKWVVILSFCNPGVNGGQQGAYLCRNKGFVTTSGAANIAVEFANTWRNQIGSRPNDRLVIVLGVNNYSSYTTAHGAAWATARAQARATVTDTRVNFVGGMDAEVEWNTDLNHAAGTIAWLNAYMNGANNCVPGSGGGACFYNFGDANCGYGATNNPCGYKDWDKDDIWYLSAGAKRPGDAQPFAAALPLIYNTVGNNARQWQAVSQYGATTAGKRVVYFIGPVSSLGACDQTDPLPRDSGNCLGIDNSNPTAYWQLYAWLATNPSTFQQMNWGTDIKYQVFP
ncbi:MAG: hypothetical protein JNL73_03725 [Anaerolineales bacterium]|nr:hypothetical protein [Anaerolineales bacterium]